MIGPSEEDGAKRSGRLRRVKAALAPHASSCFLLAGHMGKSMFPPCSASTQAASLIPRPLVRSDQQPQVFKDTTGSRRLGQSLARVEAARPGQVPTQLPSSLATAWWPQLGTAAVHGCDLTSRDAKACMEQVDLCRI